jgi:hypothetical protein
MKLAKRFSFENAIIDVRTVMANMMDATGVLMKYSCIVSVKAAKVSFLEIIGW